MLTQESFTHKPSKSIPPQRIGRIQLSTEVLLELLQYPKGSILGASYEYGVITVILEDREMPLVKEGDAIPFVTPTYVATYNKRGKVLRVKRVKA